MNASICSLGDGQNYDLNESYTLRGRASIAAQVLSLVSADTNGHEKVVERNQPSAVFRLTTDSSLL
jgi:hypothetical protein